MVNGGRHREYRLPFLSDPVLAEAQPPRNAPSFPPTPWERPRARHPPPPDLLLAVQQFDQLRPAPTARPTNRGAVEHAIAKICSRARVQQGSCESQDECTALSSGVCSVEFRP